MEYEIEVGKDITDAQGIADRIRKKFPVIISEQLALSWADNYAKKKQTKFILPLDNPKNIPLHVRPGCSAHPIAVALTSVESFQSITLSLLPQPNIKHAQSSYEENTLPRGSSVVDQYQKYIVKPSIINSATTLIQAAQALREQCCITKKAENPDQDNIDKNNIMLYRGPQRKLFFTRDSHASNQSEKNDFTKDWANFVLIEDTATHKREAYVYDASTGLTNAAFTCGLIAPKICATGMIKITSHSVNGTIKIPSIQFVSTQSTTHPHCNADAYQLVHHLVGTLNTPIEFSVMKTPNTPAQTQYYYLSQKSNPDSKIVQAIKEKEATLHKNASATRQPVAQSRIPSQHNATKRWNLHDCLISLFSHSKKASKIANETDYRLTL